MYVVIWNTIFHHLKLLQPRERHELMRKEKDKGKKVNIIGRWKSQGILCFDYDLLYDLYVKTTHCEFCNCELNKCSKTRKCLDHDHSITDKFNVRGILCISCNIKDVLK